MKKISYHLVFILFFFQQSFFVKAQSLVFNIGSNGYNCGNFGYGDCRPQPNYDVTANTATGNIYLLKREYNGNFTYAEKLIKVDSLGNRLGEIVLPAAYYYRVVVDKGSGVYVLSFRNDSVMVNRYQQGSLAGNWATGIAAGPGSVEVFDMCLAFGYLYFGYNDSTGMHLYKLDKSNGQVVSFTNYNTSFFSNEHGLDMEASSSAIFVAGYLDEPGTAKGDELWLIKFNAGLTFKWETSYNKHLGLTHNKDQASHVRIAHDTVYVCGTTTGHSGNVDAIVFKYTHNGTQLWQKTVNKGMLDHTVDCSIDPSNGDVYLLQNAFTTLNKIFVTRFHADGTQQWSKGYASTDTTGTVTRGNNIYADPDPDGTGCQVYITGQREDYGGDGHGYTNGLNDLAYKYNRSGALQVFYAPDAWSGLGGLAPYVSIKKSVYYPSYLGRPNLFLLTDGDYSNPYPALYGWRLISYNISSLSRLAESPNFTTVDHRCNVQFYPNPATEQFMITADLKMESIRLFNMAGQMVRETSTDSRAVSISVAELPRGVYVVRVKMDDTLVYSRLVIH